MKVKYIKVRGSIGFKKAFGADEIEFDFEGKEGLIALSGKNGNGKTTFIELMQHYLSFPSRKNARKKKFHHGFFLRDSFVETISVFNGKEYHIIKKIDSQTNKCEGFVKVDGSEKSETTGKISEYYKYIEKTFGSEDLYYKSIFCAQGSEKISEMTAGPIKKLLVEFLRIDNLITYEDSAKKAVLFFETKNEIHETELARLNSEIEKTSGYENDLTLLNEEKESTQRNVHHNEKRIKELRSTLDDKKDQKNKNKIILEQKEGLSRDYDKIAGDIQEIENSIGHRSHSHSMILYETDADMISLKPILDKKESIMSASEAIETNQKELDSFVTELDQVKTKVQEYKSSQNKLISDSEKIQHSMELLKADPELQKLKQAGIDGVNEIVRLTDVIKNIDRDIESTDNVPELTRLQSEIGILRLTVSNSIDPDCKSETCPAIKSIEHAKLRIPVLESNILKMQESLELIISGLEQTKNHHSLKKEELKTKTGELRDDYVIKNNKIKVDLETLRESWLSSCKLISEHADEHVGLNDEKIKGIEGSVQLRKDRIKNNQDLSGKLPDLKVAESKVEDIKKRISEETISFNQKIKELETKKTGKESEIKIINDEVKKLEEQINLTIDTEIESCQEKISDSEEANEKVKESIAILDRNIAVFENDLKKAAEYVDLMQNQRRIISAINKEISEWTYIRLGCSKNGLQALEIDGAAPLITREANKLLELSFGLDYQIKIVTQDPESGKEVFWINVIEGDGTETEIGLFSGGEKVWIVKAITLALALVSKQKSGKDFRSIFTDEEDGALDPEKAIKFIELYRALMTHGDFDTCFYISHNPQSVSMADHIIEFSGEKPKWI